MFLYAKPRLEAVDSKMWLLKIQKLMLEGRAWVSHKADDDMWSIWVVARSCGERKDYWWKGVLENHQRRRKGKVRWLESLKMEIEGFIERKSVSKQNDLWGQYLCKEWGSSTNSSWGTEQPGCWQLLKKKGLGQFGNFSWSIATSFATMKNYWKDTHGLLQTGSWLSKETEKEGLQKDLCKFQKRILKMTSAEWMNIEHFPKDYKEIYFFLWIYRGYSYTCRKEHSSLYYNFVTTKTFQKDSHLYWNTANNNRKKNERYMYVNQCFFHFCFVKYCSH